MNNSVTEIIIKDKETWDKVLQEILNFSSHDIYHKYEYANMYKSASDQVMAYYYKEDNNFIFSVLIKKKIKNTSYYDFETPYGYSSPIYYVRDQETFNYLVGKFFQFLKDQNIICGIIRSAPLIIDDSLKKMFKLEVIDSSEIVILNKKNNLETVRNNYSKDLKKNLKKADSNSLKIYFSNDTKELNNFSKIYNERMIELNANSFYLFDNIYFQKFHDLPKQNWKTISCYHHDIYVGGGIILQSKKIYNVHLTASLKKYYHLNVNEKIRDAMIEDFYRSNNIFLNFGGGKTNKKNDSLLKYKKKFSNLVSIFYLYGVVIKPGILKKIKENWIINNQNSKYKNYFLNYRY